MSIEFKALQSADGFAVLALDLDGFKEVNDVHGHAAGDIVLQTTAARLTSAVREQDLVARTGGDEFVVVIAAEIAVVRTSIGGIWTNAKRDVAELLKEADVLLYAAKAAGKDSVRFQSSSRPVV